MNKVINTFPMVEHILIKNEITNENIVCSYTNRKITIKHLCSKLQKFINNGSDIINMRFGVGLQDSKNYFYDDVTPEKYVSIDDMLNFISSNVSTMPPVLFLKLTYESKKEQENLEQAIKDMDKLENGEQNESIIKIFIRTLTGRHEIIYVSLDSDINTLKRYVQIKAGVSPDICRLVFGGKYLENNMTIRQYGLSNGSIVHCLLRLRGGMFCDVTSGQVDYQQMASNVDIDLDKDFE